MGNPLSIQEWKELYKAAIEFKETGAWNWMWDSDLFGVQNPAGGEIGYCCILGKLGESFGLVVYLGTEGLQGYLKLKSGEVDVKDMDISDLGKCLMVSYEDRRSLSKDDLRVIRKLGLIFRGHNAWPLFRSLQPGHHPWRLSKEEAIYLTLCLRQAKEVALRFKEDPDMLIPPKDNHYFVRVPGEEGDTLEWRDDWLKPLPFRKVVIMVKEVDEARLRRIEKKASRTKMTWEIDFSHAPF